MTILELDGVTVRRGATTAVAALDLSVGAGELVALLGPSGSGKTSLLRAVSGLEPALGSVRIDGVDQGGRPPERRPVSMVFDTPALLGHLDVRANVAFAVDSSRGDATPADEVDAALTALNLGAVAGARPGALSAGQRQRVALARALVRRPRVLLFDEPLAHVDPTARPELRREIVRMHRRTDAATLYVTHDAADALAIADRVVVLREGALVQVDDPRALFTRPASVWVAGLIGIPNFVATTVVGLGSGGVAVQVLGREWTVPAAPGLRVGQDCVLVGPARSVTLLPDGAPAARLLGASGQVLASAYAGDHLDYEVETDAGALLARSDPAPLAAEHRPGDRVRVGLVPQLWWALPADAAR